MNDIDNLPSKCRDCAYWELATYPWCCGDCKDIMNPKNGEYIKRIDAKRALTALSADLDAETVQRCIEAMNNLKAADVEPKQRWIPVTERKPFAEYGDSDAVLTVDSLGVMRVACWDGGNWVLTNGNFIESTMKFPITHWMPLPEIPKGEENARENA